MKSFDEELDFFGMAAPFPLDAVASGSVDLSRVFTTLVRTAGAFLNLPDIDAAVPTLRAVFRQRSLQYFSHDPDLNPPLIFQLVWDMNQKLQDGLSVPALLLLRSVRDLMIDERIPYGTAEFRLDHDPGPRPQFEDEDADLNHTDVFYDPPQPAFTPSSWATDAANSLVAQHEAALARLLPRRHALLCAPDVDLLQLARIQSAIELLHCRDAFSWNAPTPKDRGPLEFPPTSTSLH